MTVGRRGVGAAGRVLVTGVVTLAAATLVVAILEGEIGVPNASAAYFVSVVATAIVAGTVGAVLAALGSFLLYDYLFVDPRHTFTVADPGEWLNLVLLLAVGVVVGELAAGQRRGARAARDREREALAQFRVSRALATRTSTPSALAAVGDLLCAEAGMDRTWIALGPDDARERTAADTAPSSAPSSAMHMVLQRTADDSSARWRRVHEPARRRGAASPGSVTYRVRIEASGFQFGSIWGVRDRSVGDPDGTQTRLLSAAADQIGQVLAHDRLADEAKQAEIARQSDALKTALLQSVSHDLRTPLATIRAAAGTLRDPEISLSVDDQRESAAAIDREVEYLDRLVTNLLDLSRIESGNLRAERDAFELDDLIGQTLERLQPRLVGRDVEVDVDGPAVLVDPVFLDEAVTNALDNAIKHTPGDSRVRISARELPEPFVRLSVEDAGPGVPDEALPQIFEKFYQIRGPGQRSRAGTGIGLAVMRGLVEAMGGRVGARRSELGGLAIDVDLPVARLPAELSDGNRH